MSYTKPGISIIVPVYNPGTYFIPCINSLLDQTIDTQQLEIILVDDGSNDGSEYICDQLARDYPNLIRVVHEERSGYASVPRNAGIELSCGNWLFFHDADDLLMPEACERMLKHATEWNSDVLVLREARTWSDGKQIIVPDYAAKGGGLHPGW